MSSNVLALEPVRNLHHDGKPNRAEVEAAVRTIIRAFAVIVRNDNIQSSLTRERGMIFSKYCALQGKHKQSSMEIM